MFGLWQQLNITLLFLSVGEFEPLFVKIRRSEFSGKYSFISDLRQEAVLAFHQEENTDLKYEMQDSVACDVGATPRLPSILYMQNPCDFQEFEFYGVRMGGKSKMVAITVLYVAVYSFMVPQMKM